MASLAQLQTWLTEAEAARHAKATGTTVVEFWRDGRRVKNSEVTLEEIDTYIEKLEQQIAAAENVAAGRPRRRAIGVTY